MNVKQSDAALLMRSSAMASGKRVFVLWQDRTDAEMGVLWMVRFERTQRMGPSSDAPGVTFRQALVPDRWLMKLDAETDWEGLCDDDQALVQDWGARAVPAGFDLCPVVTPPTNIEAALSWPDGWLTVDASPVDGKGGKPEVLTTAAGATS